MTRSARNRRLFARPRMEQLEARTTPATLSTFLTTEHTDLNMTFSGGTNFDVGPRDADSAIQYTGDEGLLYVGTNAAQARPAGSEFDFIGVASGQTIYRLLQDQDTDLLYLGFAARGVAGGALNKYDVAAESGGRVTGTAQWTKLTLESVTGPGEFSVWQSGVTGPVSFMSTSNGVSAADSLWVPAGGHLHYNLAFTALGRYEAKFHVSGNVNTDGNTSTLESVVTGKSVSVFFSVGNVGKFSINPASYTVNETAGTASVTVTRTGGSDGRVTVNYATTDGTAKAGQDFTATSGTITFNDLQTSQTITVPIIDDTAEEGAENFTVTISQPGPSSIANHIQNVEFGGSGPSMLGATTSALVTISANDPNTAPTISAIADKTTAEDAVATVSFTVGDIQTAAGSLVVTAMSSNLTVVPAAGLSFGGSGANRTLTVTPAADASGQSTITVTVRDPGNLTAQSIFVLTVTPGADAPGVTPAATLEGQQTTSGLVISRNAMDGPEVTHFQITAVTNGTLFQNDGSTAVTSGQFFTFAQANAGLRFTPAADFAGTAKFSVQSATGASVANLSGGLTTAVVTVTGINDAPVGTVISSVTSLEDAGPFTQVNVLTAVGGGGGADEANQIVTPTITTDNKALFTVQPALDSFGTLTYTTAPNAFGTAKATVTLTDNGGTANGGVNMRTRTFTIGVTNVQEPPVAVADTATVNEDGSTLIDVLFNDTDFENNPLTVASFTKASNGKVVLEGTKLRYTPTVNFSGADTFDYTVSDGNGGQATGTVSITVTAIPDDPTAGNDDFGVTPGNVLRGNVSFNDADGDGDALTAVVTTGPTQGTLDLQADGRFVYSPGATLAGSDSFTYTVNDGTGRTSTATVTITGRSATPAVEVILAEGDVDIGIAYEGDEFEPHIHDEEAELEYEPGQGLFHLRPIGLLARPDSPAFDFIGVPAGADFYRFSQNPIGGLLYLGFGAEELVNGVFANDEVTFRVLAVDGPGQISIWNNTDTGPQVLVATTDGLTAADQRPLVAGSHTHSNWGFSARGLYAVTVQFNGVLVDGTSKVSEPATYFIAVDPANAAPVQTTPATVVTDYRATFAFTGPNGVSVADANPHSGPMQITLTANNGTVNIPTIIGVTFLTGDGVADTQIVIAGKLADLNTALTGLTFSPNVGFSGDASVVVTTDDRGFLVTENNQTTTTTIPIAVGPIPTATITATATNAAEPSTNGEVRLTRSGGDLDLPLTITLNLSGTAQAGSDYVALPTTVTFAAGQTIAVLPVSVIEDTAIEADETIVVTLPNGPGYTVTSSPLTLTVTSEDVAPLILPKGFAAGSGSGGSVITYNPDGSFRFRADPFGPSFSRGVRVATADVNGDGVDDLISGGGPGGNSRIVILDGSSLALLADWVAFENTFTGGVFVVAADLDGDGMADVIVTPDVGGGPVVSVYDGAQLTAGLNAAANLYRFFGIEDANFRGGARAAMGDVNGDGRPDLVVAAGFGGGPRVAVFDGQTLANVDRRKLMNDFFAFEDTLRNGLFPSVGDFNGDGSADLVLAAGPGGGPRVRILNGPAMLAGREETLANFFAGDPTARDGVRAVAVDRNADSIAELIVGNAGGPGRVFVYSFLGALPELVSELDIDDGLNGAFVG